MGDIAKIQKRLDDKAVAVLSKYGIPNIAAVIVRDDGDTVMSTAKGIKDTSKSSTSATNKVDKTDYFNVGSVSKPITGLFVACLVKKGVLSWNTKIKDVFPEFNSKAFRDRCGMNENFLDTKVYELISHSSGMNGTFYFLENTDNPNLKMGDGDPHRFIHDQGITNGGYSRDKEWKNLDALVYLRYLYTVLCMKKPKYILNSSKNFEYKNRKPSGYGSSITIVAAMAERKLGRPWETIMTELLFDPVPMNMTFGNMPDGMQLHYYDAATGKYKPNGSLNNDFSPYNCKYMTGGIHCTVAGIAQYIKYNLEAIDQSQRFDITQYQAPAGDVAKGGLLLGGESDFEPLNHLGETGGSLAYVEIFNKNGRGFSVMMNSADGGQRKVCYDALNEMLAELKNIHTDWESI